MESVNLSPVNQALIQQKQQVATNLQTEIKPKQIKDGKKLLIAGATAAAAISVATILIATHKSHKLKKILVESESIQKTSEEIIEKGQKLHDEAQGVVDEILDLFNKGKASNFADVLDENGNVIVKYNLNSDGELDSIIQTGLEGFKKRTGYFIDDSLKNIEIENNDGLMDKIFLHRLEIDNIVKDVEEVADGSEKASEMFFYVDRKMFKFVKGYVKSTDKSERQQEAFMYNAGKLRRFAKGYEISDKGLKAQEYYRYKDGKLDLYKKGYEYLVGVCSKTQEAFRCIDGKLQDVTNEFNAN